jgi:formylglycine-generating enzyme required for sulfatase activity
MLDKSVVARQCFVASLLTVGIAQGSVFNMPAGQTSLDLVTVGNPGNVADGTGYGAVSYTYRIGKFEVTAAQYTEFLNAVASTTDDYGLYSPNMWSSFDGCKIQRTPVAGGYRFSVAADYANRPVNYISFWDAARFVNWLHNGENSDGTETGAYMLNGYSGADGRTIIKSTGVTYWIATEDEWYKAAYHKNDGATGNYWQYPTGTNSRPGRDMTETTNPGNNANYHGSPYPIDSGRYYTTVVGAFQLSDSPYGTFDQGGNVWELTDTLTTDYYRWARGWSFSGDTGDLSSSTRGYCYPTDENGLISFRVAAAVPEPSTFALLTAAILGFFVLAYRRRTAM